MRRPCPRPSVTDDHDRRQHRPTGIIVGAGFGGIAAAIELRRNGFDQITILEAAAGLEGTWFFHTYPGSACDVPSHLYSFSFEQRHDWSRLCSPQSEILDYLTGVAEEHGITPLIRFSQRVDECRFDGAASSWRVRTETGVSYEADVVLMAAGQLNQPAVPPLTGRARFAGHSFHSARWDHDYDLRGKRVAVVGNGASAVQFVPQIAGGAAQLSVFQRTANWMLPRKNHVYPGGCARWTACDSWYRDEHGRIVANWPGYMREYVERTRTLDPDEYVFH